MREFDRKPIHRFVWDQMGKLEELGLGRRDAQRVSRDNFILKENLISRFTGRDIREGFIRSDKNHGLLFRAASDDFVSRIPKGLLQRAQEHKNGGPQWSWAAICESDVRELIDIFVKMATNRK